MVVSEERRLAAIVVGDVVGYTAMMERDEADTLSRLFALRSQLIEPATSNRGGRIVKTIGDGVLAEFPSVVNAVEAAIAIQEGLGDWPDIGEPLTLRIGVHLGDVLVRDDDIYGDGVNVAARLEQAADPGGILISGAARDQLAGHHADQFAEVGGLDLKNVARTISGWRWKAAEKANSSRPTHSTTNPSIAVLPFDNMSGDPDQDYFADGMVEDLITNLSRFHWFRVIARSSSFAFKGQTIDVPELGLKLGARYLLEGSVRRAGDRIRVTAQLIDTTTNAHLWADRFDRTLEDIFEVQDEIVQAIVGAVVPQFVSSFQPSQRPGAPTTLSSWELAMRGWNLAWRLDGSKTSILQARQLFEQALAEDDGNSLAYCGLAFSHCNPYYQAQLHRDVEAAIDAASKALEIDDRNAFAWCLLGIAKVYASSPDEAERRLKRAIAINPSLALAHAYMAAVDGFRPDSAAADHWARRAEELSPTDPILPLISAARSMARFGEADYAGALNIADETLAATPQLQPAWRLRAASLEMLGDHAAAAAALERLLELGAVTMEWLRKETTPFRDPNLWETYLEALRRAGVPD
jgi:TolB-like protein